MFACFVSLNMSKSAYVIQIRNCYWHTFSTQQIIHDTSLKFSNIYLHISSLYKIHLFSMELDLIITIKHNLEGCSIKLIVLFQVYHTLNLILLKICFAFYFLERFFSKKEEKMLDLLNFVWIFCSVLKNHFCLDNS